MTFLTQEENPPDVDWVKCDRCPRVYRTDSLNWANTEGTGFIYLCITCDEEIKEEETHELQD